jgi:tRNA pseudouridine32 synthase/23S rRNA pseudouridine746 synthase
MNDIQPIEHHIVIEQDSQPALEALQEISGLSRQKIKQAMQKGSVWLERGKQVKRLRRAKKILHKGEQLHFYYNERVLAMQPKPAQLISDEGGYSVWFKPSGMLSQGSKWGDHCTINRWVEQHLLPQRPAFVVHRLDRAATGLILIAHTRTLAASLAGLFQNREMIKRYRVVVAGHYPETPEPVKINKELDGKSACSACTRLAYDAEQNRSLLEVTIETGRKHQIRSHLADAGFPVVGDRLYGDSDTREDLQLTASYLGFCCPVQQRQIEFLLPERLLPSH